MHVDVLYFAQPKTGIHRHLHRSQKKIFCNLVFRMAVSPWANRWDRAARQISGSSMFSEGGRKDREQRQYCKQPRSAVEQDCRRSKQMAELFEQVILDANQCLEPGPS